MNQRLYDRLEAIVSRFDAILDDLPSYESGKWHRYGEWGCRMQLLGRFINRFEPKEQEW